MSRNSPLILQETTKLYSFIPHSLSTTTVLSTSQHRLPIQTLVSVVEILGGRSRTIIATEHRLLRQPKSDMRSSRLYGNISSKSTNSDITRRRIWCTDSTVSSTRSADEPLMPTRPPRKVHWRQTHPACRLDLMVGCGTYAIPLQNTNCCIPPEPQYQYPIRAMRFRVTIPSDTSEMGVLLVGLQLDVD